jgi:hypothetical protein
MRKISSFIRNMYRIILVKSNGRRMIVNYSEIVNPAENDMVSEAFLKKVITTDECCMETDQELQKMLELRMTKKGPALSSFSFIEVFVPLFSFKHIELKMAVISLALVITLGLGPTYNHSVNRSFSPFFLADTLSDSSVLNLHFAYDSAFKIQYK